MNNLNLSQNSNNLNDSPKTQEKLNSNEISLDDILTYSDDNSQNNSVVKSLSKQNIDIKEEKKSEAKPQTINSFNSEITLSFLKEKSNINELNKEKKISKSAEKPYLKQEKIIYDKNINKSWKKDNYNHILNFLSPTKGDLKDVSGFHGSISNIFSEFEIRDISISKSNCEIKKNNENNINISKRLNINNKNQISEEHSNTNSMCNYENISNLSNKNNVKKENKNEILLSDDLGDINIKMNFSLDNCYNNKNKAHSDKKKYNEEMINDTQINKKENCTTSTKKEKKNLYAQNTKQSKNLIKYTKAQCVQTLFQNKPNQENKQYQCSDAHIKTKDTTSDKKNFKKIIILSPHKLSFEIQKSDCIQISNKKAKKKEIINNEVIYNQNNKENINNNNSELSISKVEDISIDNNNNFYNNDYLKENNTTSFMISPNITNINQYINKKIIYQKNNNIRNKKIFINNRNININKEDSNNFFYNPNYPLASGPFYSNISNNNKMQTPDLNKNKMTPMTCVHKGSLIYCNDSNGNNNNTIKYNYSNNVSYFLKKKEHSFNKNMSSISNNNDNKNKNRQKKLVYLKNNVIKNNKNSKTKKNLDINNAINVNKKEDILNKIKKNNMKNNKIIGKQLTKKNIYQNNNSKLNNSFKQSLIAKKYQDSNNNSITSNNNRKSHLKSNNSKTKSNSIINKINNEIIKESSLFHILYNMPQRNVNTTKNNSGMSSKDEKESTIVQNNKSKENDKKKLSQKKMIKHKTNNNFKLYNSYFKNNTNDSKNKKSKENINNKNKNSIKSKNINSKNKNNNVHKKLNSQINLDSLRSNFNLNNINNINNFQRRKNNKSLYNFGNIFFINQNHIIKKELEANSNKNEYIKIKYKNNNIKNRQQQRYYQYESEKNDNNNHNNKNVLTASTKYNPEIINDFSKYKKKKEITGNKRYNINNNSNKVYIKQEYNETQLISEN